MRDLSEHITDIVQNSTRARATEITISILFEGEICTLLIGDNGSGMSPETLSKVSDPYFTTRTTRKQGMGLAFLRQNAEQTGGSLHISSTLGVGTTVTATFHHNHWDMPPLGDIPAAIIMLIGGNPDIEFCFNYTQNDTDFTLDTREVKEIFSPIPLSNLGVLKALREMITENIAPS